MRIWHNEAVSVTQHAMQREVVIGDANSMCQSEWR